MFADVSDRIARNPPALHYGAAALDVDGDGRTEFFVAGFGGPNRVLKWANGCLRDVAPAALADDGRQAIGVAAADIDGDGREEIYVLNTDTYAGPKQYADRLFDARPDGGWDDLFARPPARRVRNLAAGRSVAALDRRGTGRYGFFVANYGRPMRLYEVGPDGRLADVAPALGLDHTTGGRGLWTGPLVSARTDVVCVNEHGPNFVFANAGDGTFAERAGEFGLRDEDEHGRGVTAFDADGDGRLDLVYGNWEGPHRLMVRKPDGTFRDRATPAMALPSSVRTVIAADFDNDGFDELYFNNIDEPNRLFGRGKGEGGRRKDDVSDSAFPLPPSHFFTMLGAGPAADPDGRGTGACVADIDGDGVLELLVCHGEAAAQPLSLFKVPANGNGWLRVAPLTRFGAPARGAAVRLTVGGRTQTRVVCGGSGYLCQMEPVAHFGLGPAADVESVTATWPDGAQVTVERPAARRTLTLPYPDG